MIRSVQFTFSSFRQRRGGWPSVVALLASVLLVAGQPGAAWAAQSGTPVPAASPVVPPAAARSCADAWRDDTANRTRRLTADCTTAAPLLVPDGWTVDGQEHTIWMIDPADGRFRGGALEVMGGSATVRNVAIDGSALTPGCSPEWPVAGVFFLGAAGAVMDTTISNMARGQGYRCGYGILVADPSPGDVTISGNTIRDPGDSGITVAGAAAEVRDNTVSNAGLNGIAFGLAGASGVIAGNTIDHAVFAGISLEESATAQVQGNDVLAGEGIGLVVFTGATAQILDGNRISGGQAGIVVSDAGTSASVDGVTIDGPAKDGIYIQRGAEATIANSVVNASGGSGITFSDADTHGSVRDTTVRGAHLAGIFVRAGAQADAIGNTIEGRGDAAVDDLYGPFGIRYGNGADGAIRDNTISGFLSEQPASIACGIGIEILAGDVALGENAFPPPGNTSNVCNGIPDEGWDITQPPAGDSDASTPTPGEVRGTQG